MCQLSEMGRERKSGGRQRPVKQVVRKPHKPFLLILKGKQERLRDGVSGSAARSQQKLSSWRTGGSLELAEKLLLALEGERAVAGNLHRLELAAGRPAWRLHLVAVLLGEVSESTSCFAYQEEGALSEEVLAQTSSLPAFPPQGC